MNVEKLKIAALKHEKREDWRKAIDVYLQVIEAYESGTSQPSLEVIKKLALALSVTTDSLLFDENERGPGEDLRLQFEAVQSMDAEDKKIIASLIDAYIKKHQIESVLAAG